MIDVIKIASYICERYRKEYGERIDEMKLHKLLYFTQRECVIQKGKPLFDATFYGWKYGPVVIEIRDAYKNDALNDLPSEEEIKNYFGVFDVIFTKFAGKDSWSLSRLSHGETSWRNARIGLSAKENGHQPMNPADIIADAERIKQRRLILSRFRMLL